MIVSGIDEAGLGPLLGPYCAALTAFRYDETEKDPRKLCSLLLQESPGRGKLAVGDSKKIYSPGKILELERTVLSFFTLYFGRVPEKTEEVMKWLLRDEPDHEVFRNDLPWNACILSTTLPLEADPAELIRMRDKLEEQFRKKGLSLEALRVRIVPPQDFNRRLMSCGNKATACQTILAPLLREGLAPGGKMIIDRQGGRRYYGEWLLELFPGRLLTARMETPRQSLYEVDQGQIVFQVGADALCFETALASMAAKYLRELYMHGFNLYWQTRRPGIGTTAGYYNDGRRFISELEQAGVLPPETSALIRRK